MHIELTTEDLLRYVRDLESKARAFDRLVEGIEERAADYTARWHSWSKSYRELTERGTARSTLRAEHALGKAAAYRVASEELGELLALAEEV